MTDGQVSQSVLVQTYSLYNVGMDHTENTASNTSSIVAFV